MSSSNGHRKGKKQQNYQRCNMLARMKLEDDEISRHGRNTRFCCMHEKILLIFLQDAQLALPQLKNIPIN